MVDIFDYFDYRRFLTDLIGENEGRRTDRSLRGIARKVGFDPSFFCKILKGTRNLSAEDAMKISGALGLEKEEAAYFDLLAHFNQARNREAQRFYFEKLQSLRQPKVASLAQDEYYSQWYHVVIRELLNFFPFTNDFRALAAMLIPPVKPSDARRTVALLERLGMITRGTDGSRALSDAFVTAAPDVKSAVLHGFQSAMMDLGKEALERFAPDKRDIFGLTLSLSREGFEEVKELVDGLKERLLETARNDRNIDGVYQINIQAFPVSRRYEEKNNENRTEE